MTLNLLVQGFPNSNCLLLFRPKLVLISKFGICHFGLGLTCSLCHFRCPVHPGSVGWWCVIRCDSWKRTWRRRYNSRRRYQCPPSRSRPSGKALLRNYCDARRLMKDRGMGHFYRISPRRRISLLPIFEIPPPPRYEV